MTPLCQTNSVHFDLSSSKSKRASIAGSIVPERDVGGSSHGHGSSKVTPGGGSRRFSSGTSASSNYSALPHDARQRLEEMVSGAKFS